MPDKEIPLPPVPQELVQQLTPNQQQAVQESQRRSDQLGQVIVEKGLGSASSTKRG
jgi:hypothetical protein